MMASLMANGPARENETEAMAARQRRHSPDPRPPPRAHSALIPNSLMIGHHFLISAF
jgi:hypothetical protein